MVTRGTTSTRRRIIRRVPLKRSPVIRFVSSGGRAPECAMTQIASRRGAARSRGIPIALDSAERTQECPFERTRSVSESGTPRLCSDPESTGLHVGSLSPSRWILEDRITTRVVLRVRRKAFLTLRSSLRRIETPRDRQAPTHPREDSGAIGEGKRPPGSSEPLTPDGSTVRKFVNSRIDRLARGNRHGSPPRGTTRV